MIERIREILATNDISTLIILHTDKEGVVHIDSMWQRLYYRKAWSVFEDLITEYRTATGKGLSRVEELDKIVTSNTAIFASVHQDGTSFQLNIVR